MVPLRLFQLNGLLQRRFVEDRLLAGLRVPRLPLVTVPLAQKRSFLVHRERIGDETAGASVTGGRLLTLGCVEVALGPARLVVARVKALERRIWGQVRHFIFYFPFIYHS